MAVAGPSRLFYLLLLSLELAVIVLLASGPSPAAASEAVVRRICSNVDEKRDACLRILLHARWAVPCGDERCIVGRMIPSLAQPEATAARQSAINLRDRSSRDLEEAFNKCESSYNEVLVKLEDALEAFNDGSFEGAMDNANGALDDIDACENGFEHKPSPMTGTNRRVRDIVDVLASVLDLLVA